MTPSQLMLVTIVAALILMIRPSYLLFVAARGSFRRVLYRMTIGEPDFSNIRQPRLMRMLLSISEGAPDRIAVEKRDVAKAIESCIEAYATNKVLIGNQIEAEVAKLNQEQRAILAKNIDDLRSKLFHAATGVLRTRLSDALGGRAHRVLSFPFVQHMAVDGSIYYIEDFVNEIRHALSRLEH
jgi:hypothetical protein